MPRRLLPLTLALALVVAGCDDDPVEPEGPSIMITVSPASLTVAQGQSRQITITLTSTDGYTGDVVFAAENAPDGIAIEGGEIPGGSGSAQAAVVASAGALLGTAAIRIRALGPGVSETSTTLTLTVEASP